MVCAGGLVLVGPQASAATLTNATWSVSNTTYEATGTSYTYTFDAATSASLHSITMTVPTGTGGTPSVGAVSPSSVASGGSASLSGTTLTYSFTAAPIVPGQSVSVQINGLTNTAVAGSYTSTITTDSSSGAVDTGTTGTVAITLTALTSPGWSASSTTVGAAASYTYTFTTSVLSTAFTSITMTVPPGTTGTPTAGTVAPTQLEDGTVSLSGTTLTYSGAFLSLPDDTAVSIQINGLTNTTVAGVYTSEIVGTTDLGLYSGVTPAVTLTGPLSVTSPASLTWATTLNGTNRNVADAVSGDQQLTVSDQTLSGAGWDVTISATTFTNGTHTLPNAGTFVVTGNVSSITASAAPSSACVVSCTPPSNAVTYPIAVTTAASSPSPVSVYQASASSGLGAILLGGSTAADPLGWWVEVPGNAWQGAYTSTVTVAIASGP